LGTISAFAADIKPYPSCTTQPTEGDRKAAKGAFDAGNGSFNEADYATAITYWRDAYRRDCTAHALLLNLARAYELKGDRAEAVNALETYLQRKPDDPTADQIQRRIQNLKSQMTAAPPTAPVAPAPVPTSTAAPAASVPPPSLPPPGDQGTSGGKSTTPLIIAGGGVVLTVVGAIVLSGGLSKIKDAEDVCPNRQCPKYNPLTEKAKYDQVEAARDLGNTGRGQANLGGVLLGVGVVGAIGGTVWYLTSSGKGKTAASTNGAPLAGRTTLTPALSPGFAGVSLGGRF
jgi:hypothetical protein